MADKQIIIDGVDVSGCSYYYEHTRVCLVKMDAAGRYYNCANWHDCDFKKLSQKLKRKEQECEKLKSHINCICFDPSSNNNRCISYNRMAEDYERDLKQLDQLKAENDELKKCYKNNSALLDFEETNTTKLVNKVMKLEQTLTKIKEIAEEYAHNCDFSWECEKCDYSCFSKQILQKINEVENEN